MFFSKLRFIYLLSIVLLGLKQITLPSSGSKIKHPSALFVSFIQTKLC